MMGSPTRGAPVDLDQISQAVQDLDPLLLLGAAGLAVLLLAVLLVLARRRRRRRRLLEQRYGSEYTRTVQRAGSRRRAHQELMDREERRRSYEVRELEPSERERLRARLEALQAGFVDGPESAVRAAEDLVDEIATAKGYPETDRDERLQDLAVDHPTAVARHRDARAGLTTDGKRPPTTEALRESLLATRALAEMLIGREESSTPETPPPFADLVEEDDTDAPSTSRASEQGPPPPEDRSRPTPDLPTDPSRST
jgi:hypothetical protein